MPSTASLVDARHSFSLAPVHDVVRTWRARLAAAPAVDAFLTRWMPLCVRSAADRGSHAGRFPGGA
ncbi:DUF6247 family protein [Streptomyces sp. NPDC003697]